MRYYIDTEFDGHNGPLLSLAMVAEDDWSMHFYTGAEAKDPWVIANVMPIMKAHKAISCGTLDHPNEMGKEIRRFLDSDPTPVIIADSPVDIGRFCAALSTGADGGWASTGYTRMTFQVHNVECYPTALPGAIQHNAWWDAMALRYLLLPRDSQQPKDDV